MFSGFINWEYAADTLVIPGSAYSGVLSSELAELAIFGINESNPLSIILTVLSWRLGLLTGLSTESSLLTVLFSEGATFTETAADVSVIALDLDDFSCDLLTAWSFDLSGVLSLQICCFSTISLQLSTVFSVTAISPKSALLKTSSFLFIPNDFWGVSLKVCSFGFIVVFGPSLLVLCSSIELPLSTILADEVVCIKAVVECSISLFNPEPFGGTSLSLWYFDFSVATAEKSSGFLLDWEELGIISMILRSFAFSDVLMLSWLSFCFPTWIFTLTAILSNGVVLLKSLEVKFLVFSIDSESFGCILLVDCCFDFSDISMPSTPNSHLLKRTSPLTDCEISNKSLLPVASVSLFSSEEIRGVSVIVSPFDFSDVLILS